VAAFVLRLLGFIVTGYTSATLGNAVGNDGVVFGRVDLLK
jgi:hypothetical protein